jgi:hypothetical protein
MGRFRTYAFTELCGNVHAAVPLATGWHYLRDVSAPAVGGRGTRHMTPTSAIYLHIEKPRQSLAPTMAAMRTWLDSQKIELVGFRVGPVETGIAYDIRFRSKEEAGRFALAFT